MDFYEELKRLSKLRGMTVDEVMKKSIGKNLHSFQGWKQRNTLPRADELYCICKVLDVSMEHFFDDDSKDFVPERYKDLISTLDSLSKNEIGTLKTMTSEQLKNIVKMYDSMTVK